MAKHPVHIFVVENDKLFMNMLEYIFTKEISYRFIDFTCGEDCIRNLHLEPDIVLLNYKLPGLDGQQTLLTIKKQLPETRVVMMMDKGDESVPAVLLSAGADDYVMKDDGLDSIIGKLEDHFRGKEQPRRKKPLLNILRD